MKKKQIYSRLQNIILICLMLIPLTNSTGLNLAQNFTQISLLKESNIDDGQIHDYIILSNETINETIISNFTDQGGIITEGPWLGVNGFSGTINSTNLTNILNLFPNLQVVNDSSIITQMNMVHQQIQTYPAIIDNSGYNINGSSNASIAFADTGIDPTHISFNSSFGDLDFTKKIIGWNDFIQDSITPDDLNGHGTAIASIAVGGGDQSLERNSTTNYGTSLTFGGNYTHYDLFYPNHITPGWYRFKIATFETIDNESLLQLQGTFNEFSTSQLMNYTLELYENGILMNQSQYLVPTINVTYNKSNTDQNLYDVYLAYQIGLGKNPEFNLRVNTTIIQPNSLGSFANFTGIAPETKITMLRVLDNLGLGNLSTLITALDWVKANNSLYHIAALILSIGSFDMESRAIDLVNTMIEKIIDNGTMVIIAVGNMGVGTEALNDLAKNQKAIVVGATNDQDHVTYYSSQGNNFGSNQYKPDLVAPGGSLLSSHSLIIAADSNQVEYSENYNERVFNDSTVIAGTSVAAAVVGGIYNLIIQELGGWENIEISNKTALWIKSLMLMTATETGLQREDNPSTTYNEALSSPTLNRGSPDIHEGFGRINPKAIFDMLRNNFAINTTETFSLTASNVNASRDHIFARKITLEQNAIYKFSSEINITSTLDSDLYLYANSTDNKGYPIILKQSSQSGKANESFFFTNTNETQDFFVIVKAVSGTGENYLNITKMNNTIAPALANESIISSSTYNDTLDQYTFQINYTQAENFAPVKIFLKLNSTEENVTLSLYQFQAEQNNYTAGVWYRVSRRFYSPGNYSYYFIVQTGNFTVRYPEVSNLSFYISEIKNLTSDYYKTTFTTTADVNKWQFSNSPINFNVQGFNQMVQAGWSQLNILDLQENRESGGIFGSWGAMYCGITLEAGSFNTPLIDLNTNQLQYTSVLMSGTYDLVSPMIYLNSSVYEVPIIRMGLRTSIGTLNTLSIQINANRTGWVTLQQYTNSYSDWFEREFDLENYLNNYVQIRYRATYNQILDYNSKGIMVDYFEVQESNNTNNHQPVLRPIQNLQFSYPFYKNESLFIQKSDSMFDYVAFQVSFIDTDGFVPNYVYVEIGGKNYSMVNVYGKWNSTSSGFASNGIIYKTNISLFGISNTSFKFHAFDGKYYVTFNPNQKISLKLPEAQYLPISKDLSAANFITMGTPSPVILSSWIGNSAGWHQIEELGVVTNPGEWYCGNGNYNGYGNNWNTSLVIAPLYLNGTNEIFLTFDYQFTASLIGGNDVFRIEISLDNGSTWTILNTLTTNQNGYQRINQDITKYMNKTALFGFRFISDNTGNIQTANSGLYLRNIRLDINRTKDYLKPEIEYIGFTTGQKVAGEIEIQVSITDNMGLQVDKMKFYVDGELIAFSLVDGIIYYTIDTTKYSNGYIIEIVTMAYDQQDNRLTKKLLLEVDNPLPLETQIFIIGLISALAIIAIAFSYRKWKINKLIAKGDYRPTPSWRDRFEEHQFKKEKATNETKAILDKYDKKWEKEQPFKLYCKSCKTWYKSPIFEIECPSCKKDDLMIAKYCPICGNFRYFENEGIHKCNKCKIDLLKDFDKAKEEILARTKVNELAYDEIKEEAEK